MNRNTIAIVDYGMGNLRSVQKALEKVGADARITNKGSDIAHADKVVLPGVGAMAPAIAKLDQLGLSVAVREAIGAGKPFLGICLGLQLLFEQSTEGGNVEGLKILKGTVDLSEVKKRLIENYARNFNLGRVKGDG